MTELDFRAIGRSLSNWGRWGADDQIGTLNLLTPDRVAFAASLVTQGRVLQLGIPVGADGPQTGVGRMNPLHLMCENGAEQDYGPLKIADDYVVMATQSVTQWDALAHVYYDDLLYNGRSADSVTVRGAMYNSIASVTNGVAGRGVLLDVARHRGVSWMQKGDAILPAELDEVAQAQGVTIRPGDILLVRTGWWAKFLSDRAATDFMWGEPGLSLTCASWLAEKELSAVAADNYAVEVQTALPGGIGSEIDGVVAPLHMVLIRDMGMTIGEIFDLEALGADCARDGVWEFFFCAPPLPITRGLGSPINPVAIK
jgi:kynurenine formamidase